LFSSQVDPAVGQSLRQAIGPIFTAMAKYLGPQWSVGDWDGMVAALPDELPEWLGMIAGLFGMGGDGPPQELKEYDPEWGQAFWSGAFYGSCDHDRMLRSVKVPVLFTHHFHTTDEATGALLGASSDLQAARVGQLVTGAGQPFTYVDLPALPHSLHGADEQLYVDTLVEWADGLGAGRAS
ncbi:MAG: alpha/beta hydrolase, partial [Acidimicrobiales bacterium]